MAVARSVAEPSFVTAALVQRGGYFAIYKETVGEWEYYSTSVDLNPRFGRNAIITKYKGPFADGVLILKAGVAYPVTEKQLRRGLIPLSQRRTLDEVKAGLEAWKAARPDVSDTTGLASPVEVVARAPVEASAAPTAPATFERVPGTARPIEPATPAVDASEVAAGLARIRARFADINA